MIDGVDVSDPRGGTQWLFANYNWFQEVQVVGLGAPAEYGGFTGVASNSLIRSGSNRFSGLFETLYQNKGMIGDNISDEVLAENPDLTSDKLDYDHGHDVPDRRAAQARQDLVLHVLPVPTGRRRSPSGYPPPGTRYGNRAEPRGRRQSPRFIFKPTIRLGQADQLTGFIEYDELHRRRRAAPPRTSRRKRRPKQTGPEIAWNANYTKVLSSSAVFDIRYCRLQRLLRARAVQRPRHDGVVSTSTPTSIR